MLISNGESVSVKIPQFSIRFLNYDNLKYVFEVFFFFQLSLLRHNLKKNKYKFKDLIKNIIQNPN